MRLYVRSRAQRTNGIQSPKNWWGTTGLGLGYGSFVVFGRVSYRTVHTVVVAVLLPKQQQQRYLSEKKCGVRKDEYIFPTASKSISRLALHPNPKLHPTSALTLSLNLTLALALALALTNPNSNLRAKEAQCITYEERPDARLPIELGALLGCEQG